VIETLELSSQDFPIQQEERGHRLVLGRGGNTSLEREVREEGDDFSASHFIRMADAVEVDVAADPPHVGGFGPGTVVA
jgi:hypothetical protein